MNMKESYLNGTCNLLKRNQKNVNIVQFFLLKGLFDTSNIFYWRENVGRLACMALKIKFMFFSYLHLFNFCEILLYSTQFGWKVYREAQKPYRDALL